MTPLTSLQRVLATLGHQEPDRTPFFLTLTLHGARELGLSIQDYFSTARNVVEGQLRMRRKYRHDCLYPFFYAALEVEAFGGEVRYLEDGPPNAAEPFLRHNADIDSLESPRISEATCLRKMLEAISGLKAEVGSEAPIIGVVMSPFSLPVMQLGFERYLVLMHEEPERFWKLMRINQAFCIDWANAQLAAGATAICYFDPISSPTIVARDTYLDTGFKIAQETIARIQGPTATHLASGRTQPILLDLPATGTAIAGVSCDEDLAELKRIAAGKITLLGNLNGITMRRWTPVEAEAAVKEALVKAARGGGFILADTHGEIPFQVPEDVLMAISEAVHTWGRAPFAWMDP